MWVAVWLPCHAHFKTVLLISPGGTTSNLLTPAHQHWTCLGANPPAKDTDPGSRSPSGHTAEQLWGPADPQKAPASSLSFQVHIHAGLPACPFSLPWEHVSLWLPTQALESNSLGLDHVSLPRGVPGEVTQPLQASVLSSIIRAHNVTHNAYHTRLP